MTILTWIIIGSIAASIITLLLGIYFFVQIILVWKQLKARSLLLPPKRKRKKKKWVLEKTRLIKKKKKAILFTLVTILLSSSFGLSAGFVMYHQSINLSKDDATAIVRSYYLLRDFQSELEKTENHSQDAAASQQNIRYLATTMSSYTAKKGSILNTTEGPSALNRYYGSLAQLGINATKESNNFYDNPALVAEFHSDIKKVIEYENVAFKYFKVKQSVLEQEGSQDGK